MKNMSWTLNKMLIIFVFFYFSGKAGKGLNCNNFAPIFSLVGNTRQSMVVNSLSLPGVVVEQNVNI